MKCVKLLLIHALAVFSQESLRELYIIAALFKEDEIPLLLLLGFIQVPIKVIPVLALI